MNTPQILSCAFLSIVGYLANLVTCYTLIDKTTNFNWWDAPIASWLPKKVDQNGWQGDLLVDQ